MKIKRLEISGFKSFADRVMLDFQQGVTGVVGPNGCGKSNIVDAIRWCMGEQSAKNLRGKAMEDIIFAGSESRRSLGLAEVSLIFSTEDGRAPSKYLDFSEIQLTRRLYRNGESEYLLNKIPCRLMDITELFMDTGVGTRAYSIIEQGKIGQILHSRPEERRFLIEEAAGVTKFKSRKHLALKKIEATKLNLARLGDVLGEIRRQLSSLQRQARKAGKFREYRDELREIDLLFTAREYCLAQEQCADTARDLSMLNDRIREVFAAAALGESQSEDLRLEHLEAEKCLSFAQEDIYRVRSEFAAAESRLEFQRKELTGLLGRLTRLTFDAGDQEKRLAECVEQRGLLELRRDTSACEAAATGDDLQQAEGELTGHQQAEDELNRMLEERRKELFTALAELAQFKNRHENAQKRLTGTSERLKRHSREAVQLQERLVLARLRSTTLGGELATAEQEQGALQVEVVDLRVREEELRSCLPELEKGWHSCRDELNRASSRLHSLRELEAQFAGYGQGVKNLMKASELRSCFSGLLADLIEAPDDLEAVLEAALAERLQCLLCVDDTDAMRALEFLKNSKGGRVGLALPLEVNSPSLAIVSGATPLAGLVHFSGQHEGLIRHILADCMLVEDIGQAVLLARQHPALTFITREGDMVSQGGVVTGGSSEQVQQGIIHKKREIKELESRVTLLEQEVSVLGNKRDELRRQSQVVAEGVKTTGVLLHQVELKLTGLRKDRQQVADEISRIEERLEVQELEECSLSDEKGELEAESQQALARMGEISSASKSLEQEVARLKKEGDTRREQLSVVRERVTAIRVQTATLLEQHEAHLRSLNDLELRSQELSQRMTDDCQEMKKVVAEQSELEGLISASTERLEGLIRHQLEAENRLATIRSSYESVGSAMAAAEARAKQSREASETVRQTQAELNLRFSTLSMQAEQLERGLLERSRIAMAEALAKLEVTEFDESVSKARRLELQKLLDEMGEVNLMAIDECAGMEERFTFLNSQKDDLEESLRSLQQAIQRINRTTRQRFLETYNQVNAKFQEVFPRLFCGGEAELRLTNEEDLLETGIDIVVQPPGKKLQNVTLLSGGEKALTAVALIFSIFLIKPTPFCLLDEVDAPLDDANIARFNEMVREMSAISQFIIITHNKATMQVADTLYGITMEEPGTSKVVSVRLN